MKITINKVEIAKFLDERLQEKQDIKDYLLEISSKIAANSKSMLANMYVEKKIEEDKFLGIKNIWFIFVLGKKYVKVKGNWTFNIHEKQAKLYVTKIIPLSKKIYNGVPIEINSKDIDATKFILSMEEIKKDKKFVLLYEDTSDIISAIELYEKITIKQDKESEIFLESSKFEISRFYRVDYSAIKGFKIDCLRAQKSFFIDESDAKRVPRSLLSKDIYLVWTANNISLPSGIKSTLRSIMKDNGDLYTITNPKKYKLEKSVSLVDFKIKFGKNKGQLRLVTREIPGELQIMDYFAIIDRLRHKKRSTMLSVMEDIKQDRINNNNLFQFLFNNGQYSKVDNISDWKINDFLSKKYSSDLFQRQLEAFNLCIDDFPITFIQGPPGTGKTHLITQVAKYYNEMKMNVLVSSQTNVAVENIIENLWKDKKFHDIPVKADFKQSKYSETNISCNSLNKIKEILELEHEVNSRNLPLQSFGYSSRVVGSTTTSSILNSKRWYDFNNNIDVLIVDEISKSSVPELIRYVTNAKKIIFVGDQKQLSPLEEISVFDAIWDEYDQNDQDIIQNYISISIFDKLFKMMKSNQRAITLDVNKRSVESIAQAYELFYEEGLNPQRKNSDSKIKWISGFQPYYPFTFLSMNGSNEIKEKGGSRFNIPEAEYIEDLMNELTQKIDNVADITVAIITFYGAQVKKIKENVMIEKYRGIFKKIKVDTVDSFQGDQADIVIISSVREDKTLSVGFIDDYRRTNVAISRARDQVFFLGSQFLLPNITMRVDQKRVNYYDKLFNLLNNNDNDSFYQKPIQFRKVA